MITVPEAARRIGRNPETIRRWIREGRLRARKIGTQHVIEENDLLMATDPEETLASPPSWGRTLTGEPMPNVVAGRGPTRSRPRQTYGMMGGMEKTTVYLTLTQKHALALAAKASGRSEAELIREGVDTVTSRHRLTEPTLPLFASNQPDLAERVDENLEGYGER